MVDLSGSARRIRPIALLLAVAIAATLPTVIWPNTFDSGVYNYVWTKQFGEALGRGELYPRWLPDSFMGLGSPTFYFYPPLAYYVSGLAQLVGAPTWQAIGMSATLTLFASGLSMTWWLKDKTPHAAAWGCAYMLAPYHLLTDLYTRGALAEFAAYAWLPLLAKAFEGRPRLLAVSFAGLIFTHLPVAVLAGVFLVGPLMLREVVERRSVVPFLLAGGAALAVSGVYLVPALTLQKHVAIEQLWGPGFRPSGMTIWLGSVWQPALFCAVGAGLVSLVALPRFWAFVGLTTALLAVGVIPALWSLPILEKVQFPMRLLAVSEFAAITAISVEAERARLRVALAAGTFVWVSNLGPPAKVILQDNPAHRAFIARAMPDAPEYLPAGAAPSGLSTTNRNPQIARYQAAARFAFPIWMVDGRPAEGIVIPKNAVIERRVLPVETWGWALSGAGLVVLGLSLLSAPLGLRRLKRGQSLVPGG